MTTQQLLNKLTWREVDNRLAPDTRVMMRQERFALQAAVDSRDTAKIQAATAEARRVAEMWGVQLEGADAPAKQQTGAAGAALDTRIFNFRAYRGHARISLGHHETLEVEVPVTETEAEIITSDTARAAMWAEVKAHVAHIEHAYDADSVTVFEDGEEVRL